MSHDRDVHDKRSYLSAPCNRRNHIPLRPLSPICSQSTSDVTDQLNYNIKYDGLPSDAIAPSLYENFLSAIAVSFLTSNSFRLFISFYDSL